MSAFELGAVVPAGHRDRPLLALSLVHSYRMPARVSMQGSATRLDILSAPSHNDELPQVRLCLNLLSQHRLAQSILPLSLVRR
jgi:hypothetical protein